MTPKPQANQSDDVLDTILEVIIPRAGEVDGMTEGIHNLAKLTAKQQIQALITEAERKARSKALRDMTIWANMEMAEQLKENK